METRRDAHTMVFVHVRIRNSVRRHNFVKFTSAKILANSHHSSVQEHLGILESTEACQPSPAIESIGQTSLNPMKYVNPSRPWIDEHPVYIKKKICHWKLRFDN
jgi:hypothetical protein